MTRTIETIERAGTNGDLTNEGRRWLTGNEAWTWGVVTGQRLKKGRVEIVEKDLRAAHLAATLASLRPEDGLVAIVATHEIDRIGFRMELFNGQWKRAAAILDTIVGAIDDEDHNRDMEEADLNEYGDQL